MALCRHTRGKVDVGEGDSALPHIKAASIVGGATTHESEAGEGHNGIFEHEHTLRVASVAVLMTRYEADERGGRRLAATGGGSTWHGSTGDVWCTVSGWVGSNLPLSLPPLVALKVRSDISVAPLVLMIVRSVFPSISILSVKVMLSIIFTGVDGVSGVSGVG